MKPRGQWLPQPATLASLPIIREVPEENAKEVREAENLAIEMEAVEEEGAGAANPSSRAGQGR